MTEIKSPLKSALCELKKLNIKITKDVANTFFKSKYADLAGILDAIEAEAAKLGIVIISKLQRTDGALELYTKITHKDSDELEDSIFPVFGAKPQEIGSSVTYARRYNIQSLLNLAAEDDDGNSANDAPRVEARKPTATKAVNVNLVDLLNKAKDSTDIDNFWHDNLPELNRLKNSTSPADKDFYAQIVKRGAELRETFNNMVN